MRKTWLILWLTMLCSAEAMAQSPSDKKWEFSIFAGGGGLAGDTFLTPVQGEGAHPVTLDVKGGYIYGFRITEQRRRHWGAELEYSFANHPSALVDLRPGSRRLDLDQRVHKISYSFLINPWRPPPLVRPFALLGAGASLFQLVGDSEQRAAARGVDLTGRWKFAVNYGAGVKLDVAPQWGFRVDVRDQVTGIPDYGLPSLATIVNGQQSPAFRPDGLFHNWQFNIGIAYRFDVR